MIARFAVLFSNAPAHVEPRQIAGGQRPHGHAEIVQRLIHRFHRRALFHQELRLAPIRPEHPIADESAAIAH